MPEKTPSLSPEAEAEKKFLEKKTEYEKKIEKYKAFYEYLRPLGEVFSHYGIYELEVDPRAEVTHFLPEEKKIVISLRLIEGLGLTLPDEKWILFHELAHLIQFFQDPKSFLETYEIAKEKAKKKAEEQGEEIGKVYEKAYKKFFNKFKDIHANSIVERLMPVYQKGGREEKIPLNLYREKLFPPEDYTEDPYSVQFLNYLLRRKMVDVDEEIKISPRVEEVVKKPFTYFGQEYQSLEEFVKKEIGSPQYSMKYLLRLLKEPLLPIYEKLLEEDIKNNRAQNILQKIEKIGEMDFDKGLDEETFRKILKDYQAAKKSPQEKYKDYLKEQFRKWAKGKGFGKEKIKRMEEIKGRTEKNTRDLKDLWENFIQKSIEFGLAEKEGFRTGAGVSPTELVAQIPLLLTQPQEAKIFYRHLPETKKEVIKPKKIRLFLLPDLSGSMDGPKREAVQEVAYSLNKSLINFWRTGKLAFADSQIDFPISIDYQIIGFGGSIEELTERTPQEDKEGRKIDTLTKSLDEELWRAIFKIEAINLGGTLDALALEKVKKELEKTPEQRHLLEKGEEIWIVLEITDGETATAQESERIVKELNQIPNVYCRAIQIPGPVFSEEPGREKRKKEIWEERIKKMKILPPTGTFKKVWGEKWGKRLENLSILKETIVSILYDALRKRI